MTLEECRALLAVAPERGARGRGRFGKAKSAVTPAPAPAPASSAPPRRGRPGTPDAGTGVKPAAAARQARPAARPAKPAAKRPKRAGGKPSPGTKNVIRAKTATPKRRSG